MIRMQFEHNEMGLLGEQEHIEPQRKGQVGQRITVSLGGGSAAASTGNVPLANNEFVIPDNINRNSPCPCGSGLKYKQCHGKL